MLHWNSIHYQIGFAKTIKPLGLYACLLAIFLFKLTACSNKPERPPHESTVSAAFVALTPEVKNPHRDSLEYYFAAGYYQDYLLAAIDNWNDLRKQRLQDSAVHSLKRSIEKVLPLIDATRDSVLALAYHKAGVSYYYLDQCDVAIQNWEKALAIRQAALSPDHPDIIRTYHNIGDCYHLQDDDENAIRYLKQSLALQPPTPVSPYPETLKVLGRIYDDKGDAYQAGKYLQAAALAYQQFYPDQPWRTAGVYSDLAVFNLNQQNYGASVEASRQALDMRLKLHPKYREDSVGISISYNNLGVAYSYLNELEIAIAYHDSSRLLNQLLYEPLHPSIARNENNLGALYRKIGRYEQSYKALQRSRRINEHNQDIQYLSSNYHNLGNLFYDQGDYDRALMYSHQAVCELVPGLSVTDPKGIPSIQQIKGEPLRVLENLAEKAKTHRASFHRDGKEEDLQLSREVFDTLSVLIDRMRLSYLADDSKINLVRQTKPVFAEAIKTSLALFEHTQDQTYAEQAFSFSEKSKALVLLEALKEAKARQFAGLEEEDLQKEKALKQQIARLEADIYAEQGNASPDVKKLQAWNEELLEVYSSYETLIEEFERQSPEYYRLKYDTRILKVADIQSDENLLSEDQVLLEFFVGEDVIYAFLISRDDFRVETLPLDFPLASTVNTFRQSINGFLNDPEETLPVYLTKAEDLYQKIWAPLANDLPKNLIIIPDDVLGLLPFEALISETAEEGQPLQELPYLIKQHQISYNYSATLLKEHLKAEDKQRTSSKVLAFAPTFEQNIDQPSEEFVNNPIALNTARKRSVNQRRGLQPLFFNRPEVEAISQIVGAKVLIGPDANKANFRELAPRYRFLHIATHGLADNEAPDYSFVAFTQPADTILLDEVLLVNELYTLALNADMVVLSACETGIGKIQRGEGIVSLARGFSYAGVRSIITTLWNISDERSNDLMTAFYTELKKGASKDEALRHAKMQFVISKSNLAHPYFWAGFVPLGDMESVEFAAPGSFWGFPRWSLGLALVALLGGLVFWWKR